MARQMTATEVKAKLLAVLDEVEAGEEVVITRRGRTIARLVPTTGGRALLGSMRGVAATQATDEELFSTGEQWEFD